MTKKSRRTKELKRIYFDAGLYVICGKNPHLKDKQKCQECTDRSKLYPLGRSEISKEQRRQHMRDKRKNRVAKDLCALCGKQAVSGLTVCEECREKNNQRNREIAIKVFDEVLEHYGRRCACCGESHPVFL